MRTENPDKDNGSEVTSVSVVIPCYNAKRFVAYAIESVLKQSFSDLTVIVVDDGSTDGTFELLEEQYASNGRIRILTHANRENRGVLAARRLGVDACNSKYVAFLDADDVFLDNKLERQVAIMEAHPQSVLTHGPVEITYDDLVDPACFVNCFSLGDARKVYMLADDNLWLDRNPVCNSAALIRAEPLRDVLSRLTMRPAFQYEDWLVWCLLGSYGSFVYDPEILLQYRFHGESATASLVGNRLLFNYAHLEFLLQLLANVPFGLSALKTAEIRRRIQLNIMDLFQAYACTGLTSIDVEQEAARLFGKANSIRTAPGIADQKISGNPLFSIWHRFASFLTERIVI